MLGNFNPQHFWWACAEHLVKQMNKVAANKYIGEGLAPWNYHPGMQPNLTSEMELFMCASKVCFRMIKLHIQRAGHNLTVHVDAHELTQQRVTILKRLRFSLIVYFKRDLSNKRTHDDQPSWKRALKDCEDMVMALVCDDAVCARAAFEASKKAYPAASAFHLPIMPQCIRVHRW